MKTGGRRERADSLVLADPDDLIAHIAGIGCFHCIVGPSGYGLPLTVGADLSEEADPPRAPVASLAKPAALEDWTPPTCPRPFLALPIMFTPGVVHLAGTRRHTASSIASTSGLQTRCAPPLWRSTISPSAFACR